MDNEKLSINLPPVELGKIDVLVAQGLFASRTDLIRTAIRQLLDAHSVEVDRVLSRTQGLGHLRLSREGLEDARRKGKKLAYEFIGRIEIDEDVTADLATATLESIRIFGSLRASKEVVDALGARIKRSLSR